MKESLFAAGSYLLLGTVSCFALAAVAGTMKGTPLSATAAPQETVEVSTAGSKQTVERAKPRRSRRNKAQKGDPATDVAPRKVRTKKPRRKVAPAKPQEQGERS